MFKNLNNILVSSKYIIVSGASKGFNYILLFYFAVGVYSNQYITILLLLSLEQILSLLLPLNQSNLIYSKQVTDYKLITNKMTTNSICVVLFYVACYIIFFKQISSYFQVDNVVVFGSLFVSMLANSYLVHLTNYYKIVNEHKKALIIQALLLISFLCIILLTISIRNVVVAFFLGKAIGLLLVLFILRGLKLLEFTFNIIFLSRSEIRNFFNLFSVSALGWVSGLGLLNLAKLYSTEDQLLKMGYILNVYNIFLLLSIGVNSIYAPLIKNCIVNKNLKKSKKVKYNALAIYLIISLGAYGLYFIMYNVELGFNTKVNTIISILPFAILLLIFNAFNWVVQPFYLVNDKFKIYNLLNVFSYLLWVVIVFSSLYFGYNNFIFFLLSIHFIKSAFAFYYSEKIFGLKYNNL